MNKLPPVQLVMCERCGHDRAEHQLANLADGPFTGLYLMVCPTALFKAKGYNVSGRPEVTDHG